MVLTCPTQATDRTVLVPLAPVSANKKKSKPKSASGGKRSRKELKVRLLLRWFSVESLCRKATGDRCLAATRRPPRCVAEAAEVRR